MAYHPLKNQLQQELAFRELARRDILFFIKYTFPAFKESWHHKEFASILLLFVRGVIKRLIVTMPPQHSKSEMSTRRLAAFLLGLDPDLRLGIASYNASFARKFSRDVQRVISDQKYYRLFPTTTLSKTQQGREYAKENLIDMNEFSKTMEEFEVIGHRGSLKSVGRGGSLTGNPIDIMLMDDLYKDYAEGNSPVIREAVIDWYTSVVRTRYHNDSQELIVFTRWNENDLIGYLEQNETVVTLDKRNQLENIDKDIWYKINFPALSTPESIENEFDHRKELEQPLWPDKHGKRKLFDFRMLDDEKFESLYQGNPKPTKGLLYTGFNTWSGHNLPKIKARRNYTDVADKGKDFLCSICYDIGLDDNLYVKDVIYTQQPQEETEIMVADALRNNSVQEAVIESNSGGRAFARNVDRISRKKHTIIPFYQSENKESRIITNSAELQRKLFFPVNWTDLWPVFARDLLNFRKNFTSNQHDDAPDALTGCLEHSGVVDENNVDALYEW